jgi:hypothetical protein
MAGFDPTQFDTASGRRLKAPCDGCDPGAELTFIPELIYFGHHTVDTESEWFPFLVKNTGIVPVGVEGIELTDPEVDFEIQDGGPVALAPGEVHTYNIRFKPTTNGSRTGYLQVRAAIVRHLPLVGLVGVGGLQAVGIPGGSTGTPTGPVGTPWSYRYASFAVDGIVASEILLDYHVTTEHRLQANFAGCRFSVGAPPAAPFALQVLKDGVLVGTVTINPDGTMLRETVNASSVLFPVNSIVTVRAPAAVDAAIRRLRMTFVGVI